MNIVTFDVLDALKVNNKVFNGNSTLRTWNSPDLFEIYILSN